MLNGELNENTAVFLCMTLLSVTLLCAAADIDTSGLSLWTEHAAGLVPPSSSAEQRGC